MTRTEVRQVATAIVGDVAIEFRDDGSATMTAGMTLECDRCNALHDLEGDPISFDPAEAWGLLQAVRRFLPADAYRQAAEAILWAIGGK